MATRGVWLGLRLDVRLGKSKGRVFARGQVEALAGSLWLAAGPPDGLGLKGTQSPDSLRWKAL